MTSVGGFADDASSLMLKLLPYFRDRRLLPALLKSRAEGHNPSDRPPSRSSECCILRQNKTMSAEIQVNFALYGAPEDAYSILFGTGSGLERTRQEHVREDGALKSELGAGIQIAALVMSAVQAAAALHQLVRVVRSRITGEPASRASEKEPRPLRVVSITVDGVRYDITDSSPEEIRRLLEK
jgi:hypothetical protein